MKVLLDTHTFLWSISEPEKLSDLAKITFLDEGNDLYLSAASYWEICIKKSLDKVSLGNNWINLFDQEVAANKITWLPISKAHCQTTINLPFIHRDPFDRLLVAQAKYENMTLLTKDKYIQKYSVKTVW